MKQISFHPNWLKTENEQTWLKTKINNKRMYYNWQ